jgi:dTDP-4-dehydrorhamnose reductase
MRILLIGKYGQLGWQLRRTLPTLGEVDAYDYPEIDLARPADIRDLVQTAQPDVIVNAAAYTAVDRAEEEREVAWAINGHAPGELSKAAQRVGAGLIHFSTDYVFDGTKGEPYVETDSAEPCNAYGESKLAGERAIQASGGAFLIFRTSWVYSLRRSSFVTKVLSWARQHETLNIVDDQISNPTWCRMLAEITAHLLAQSRGDPIGWISDRPGLYHLAGSGYASRLEWAKAILSHDPEPEAQVVKQILPAKTADFPTPAPRPLFSALDCSRFEATFGLQLPPWAAALQMAMDAGV